MTIKTIFLDRDGVINKEVNYLYKIKDFEFIEGIFEACQYFNYLGYSIIIVTNQSGISRGYYDLSDYEILNRWMLSQFENRDVIIQDVFHCPHVPESKCSCRKPKPGLLTRAQTKYNIDMKNSWLIGDNETDIEAAISAGISNTIIVRSGHIVNETASSAKFILDSVKQSKEVITT